jgi:hypothetical protein
VDGRREKLVALACALPEAEAERAGAQHLSFKVRKKIFAYYAYDHHGDGRIALLCKAPPGEQPRLVAEDAGRYFVPPYVGPKGWVGFRLDTPRVDWKVVQGLLLAAYFMTAPDKLRGQLEQNEPRGPVRSDGPKKRRRR